MKKLLILLFISMVLIVGCQAQKNDLESAEQAELSDKTDLKSVAYKPGSWITDYQMALTYAKELERPILINFTGSDWCPWCFRLRDEVFVQPEFISYAEENLVLLTLDFPRKTKLPAAEAKTNQALAEKYDIEGFPTILLINSQEKEIARTGYQEGGAKAYVKHLQDLLVVPENVE